ncbi:hypothetical protein Agub_g1070, partial [Astrephomene gubernaculifera]
MDAAPDSNRRIDSIIGRRNPNVATHLLEQQRRSCISASLGVPTWFLGCRTRKQERHRNFLVDSRACAAASFFKPAPKNIGLAGTKTGSCDSCNGLPPHSPRPCDRAEVCSDEDDGFLTASSSCPTPGTPLAQPDQDSVTALTPQAYRSAHSSPTATVDSPLASSDATSQEPVAASVKAEPNGVITLSPTTAACAVPPDSAGADCVPVLDAKCSPLSAVTASTTSSSPAAAPSAAESLADQAAHAPHPGQEKERDHRPHLQQQQHRLQFSHEEQRTQRLQQGHHWQQPPQPSEQRQRQLGAPQGQEQQQGPSVHSDGPGWGQRPGHGQQVGEPQHGRQQHQHQQPGQSGQVEVEPGAPEQPVSQPLPWQQQHQQHQQHPLPQPVTSLPQSPSPLASPPPRHNPPQPQPPSPQQQLQQPRPQYPPPPPPKQQQPQRLPHPPHPQQPPQSPAARQPQPNAPPQQHPLQQPSQPSKQHAAPPPQPQQPQLPARNGQQRHGGWLQPEQRRQPFQQPHAAAHSGRPAGLSGPPEDLHHVGPHPQEGAAAPHGGPRAPHLPSWGPPRQSLPSQQQLQRQQQQPDLQQQQLPQQRRLQASSQQHYQYNALEQPPPQQQQEQPQRMPVVPPPSQQHLHQQQQHPQPTPSQHLLLAASQASHQQHLQQPQWQQQGYQSPQAPLGTPLGPHASSSLDGALVQPVGLLQSASDEAAAFSATAAAAVAAAAGGGAGGLQAAAVAEALRRLQQAVGGGSPANTLLQAQTLIWQQQQQEQQQQREQEQQQREQQQQQQREHQRQHQKWEQQQQQQGNQHRYELQPHAQLQGAPHAQAWAHLQQQQQQQQGQQQQQRLTHQQHQQLDQRFPQAAASHAPSRPLPANQATNPRGMHATPPPAKASHPSTLQTAPAGEAPVPLQQPPEPPRQQPQQPPPRQVRQQQQYADAGPLPLMQQEHWQPERHEPRYQQQQQQQQQQHQQQYQQQQQQLGPRELQGPLGGQQAAPERQVPLQRQYQQRYHKADHHQQQLLQLPAQHLQQAPGPMHRPLVPPEEAAWSQFLGEYEKYVAAVLAARTTTAAGTALPAPSSPRHPSMAAAAIAATALPPVKLAAAAERVLQTDVLEALWAAGEGLAGAAARGQRAALGAELLTIGWPLPPASGPLLPRAAVLLRYLVTSSLAHHTLLASPSPAAAAAACPAAAAEWGLRAAQVARALLRRCGVAPLDRLARSLTLARLLVTVQDAVLLHRGGSSPAAPPPAWLPGLPLLRHLADRLHEAAHFACLETPQQGPQLHARPRPLQRGGKQSGPLHPQQQLQDGDARRAESHLAALSECEAVRELGEKVVAARLVATCGGQRAGDAFVRALRSNARMHAEAILHGAGGGMGPGGLGPPGSSRRAALAQVMLEWPKWP